MSQIYHRSDVIHVNKDLGPYKKHFRKDYDGIVIGSYKDQYGDSNHRDYTIMDMSGNTSSWYDESELTFIRKGAEEEIQNILTAKTEKEKIESDLTWIITNWPNIRETPSCATMNALMLAVGIDKPWGNHGEVITYYSNMMNTRAALDTVLLTGDRSVVDAKIAYVKTFIDRINQRNQG